MRDQNSASAKPQQTYSSARIRVKHLAREFDREPMWIRKQLRREFIKPVGRYWEWREGRDADKIREWLRQKLEGAQS